VASFDGHFKRVNHAFSKTLGHTEEEILARPWLDFVHPDDRAATVAQGERLAAGGAVLYFHNRYHCKDGSYKWLSWTAVPVVQEKLIYAVARDMTDRIRAEEELRAKHRQLEQAMASE